jgi:hypothetical protein
LRQLHPVEGGAAFHLVASLYRGSIRVGGLSSTRPAAVKGSARQELARSADFRSRKGTAATLDER